MKIKRKAMLPVLLTGIIFLGSCGTDGSAVFDGALERTGFYKCYSYHTNLGADGVAANLNIEDPGSYDDTMTVEKLKLDGTSDVDSYLSSGKVTMPDAVRTDVKTDYGQGYPIVEISSSAFLGKTAITDMELSKNLQTIGNSAFYGMSGLVTTNLTSLNNLSYIGSDAFVDVPWYLSYLASHQGEPIIFGNVLYAISGTLSDSTFVVPDNIVQIASGAFKGQSGLNSVILPDGLKMIGANAFEQTGLASLTLPSSVTSVGDEAFKDCKNLSLIDAVGSQDNVLGANVFSGDTNVTELSYSGNYDFASLFGTSDLSLLSTLSFTGGTSGAVAQDMFAGANMPLLTSVDMKGVTYIGSGAFSGMVGISGLTNTDSVEYAADNSFADTLWYANKPVGPLYLGHCFLGFKGDMTQIVLPDGITGISGEAMDGYAFPLTVPQSVKYLGSYALDGAIGLTDINLPNIKEVGDYAFANCTELASIVLADNAVLGEKFCKGDVAVTYAAMPYGDSLKALFGKNTMPKLATYKFLAGPESVIAGMFTNMTTLVSVDFGTTINTIGDSAFKGCTGLTSLIFPKTMGVIGMWAFFGCTSLNNVKFEVEKGLSFSGKLIYKGVSKLSDFCFAGCTLLSYSTVGDDMGAKEGTFVIPESIVSLKGTIFAGTSVTHITVRVPYYYFAGQEIVNDITIVEDYIPSSSDWNCDYNKKDAYGNPLAIGYDLVPVGK